VRAGAAQPVEGFGAIADDHQFVRDRTPGKRPQSQLLVCGIVLDEEDQAVHGAPTDAAGNVK
jgi:hypothetical protein